MVFMLAPLMFVSTLFDALQSLGLSLLVYAFPLHHYAICFLCNSRHRFSLPFLCSASHRAAEQFLRCSMHGLSVLLQCLSALYFSLATHSTSYLCTSVALRRSSALFCALRCSSIASHGFSTQVLCHSLLGSAVPWRLVAYLCPCNVLQSSASPLRGTSFFSAASPLHHAYPISSQVNLPLPELRHWPIPEYFP